MNKYIPIIGTIIKPMAMHDNENLFCYKLVTLNNESFILGSNSSKEINDWIQAIRNIQKEYKVKMNDIKSNFNVIANNVK